jgi:hypothetical protein
MVDLEGIEPSAANLRNSRHRQIKPAFCAYGPLGHPRQTDQAGRAHLSTLHMQALQARKRINPLHIFPFK